MKPTAEYIQLMSEGKKLCRRCDTVKVVDDFSKYKSGKLSSYCKACKAEITRQYFSTRKEKRRTLLREWKRKNRHRVRQSGQRERERIRNYVFTALGGVCKKCGFSDWRALQVDHIDRATEPDGHKLRCGTGLYRAIANGTKSTDGLQLLCANCNWIKRYENNEHNSKRKIIEVADGSRQH